MYIHIYIIYAHMYIRIYIYTYIYIYYTHIYTYYRCIREKHSTQGGPGGNSLWCRRTKLPRTSRKQGESFEEAEKRELRARKVRKGEKDLVV